MDPLNPIHAHKWEYYVTYIDTSDEMTPELNALGELGWELTGMAYNNDTEQNCYVLKRRRS